MSQLSTLELGGIRLSVKPPISPFSFSPILEELSPELLGLAVSNPDFCDVKLEKPASYRKLWTQFEAGWINYEAVVDGFIEWRDTPVFVATWKAGSRVLSFFRGKKRGDPQYIKMIRGKNFSRILEFAKDHNNLNLWKFITLTVKLSGKDSVFRIQEDWNRFLTILRYHYKGIKVFRAFELQLQRLSTRGEIAVHIHALIYGPSFIPKSKINQWWGKGWTDIQRPRSIRGIAAYLNGYLTKTFADPMNTAYFFATHSRQWSSNFPCLIETISKNDGVWGGGVSPKNYGLGAVWWWWGRDVYLFELSKAGFHGWEYAFEHGDWDGCAAVLVNTIKELKGVSLA